MMHGKNGKHQKIGGGEHKSGSPQNDKASCWNVNWYYDGSTKNLVTLEYIHPDYEFGHTVEIS